MIISRRYGEKISPEMIGLFFEDINFAADGGLYAEMLENRSFEAREAHGTPGNFYAVDDFGYAWSPVFGEGEEKPVMQYITGTPLSEANPHYLRFTAKAAGQGFANQAYDGIYLEKGEAYTVSFYARCVAYEGEMFTAEVRKDGRICAGGQVRAVKQIPYLPFSDLKMDFTPERDGFREKFAALKALDTSHMSREHQWNYYELQLVAQETVHGADFVISLETPGVVEFDLISMMPGSAVAGIFRKDLFDALKALKPGFIRFPGGCIVEGISLENRYQWKRTVGDLKDRRYIPNLWAFDDERSREGLDVMRETTAHYGQSYGLGYYEYFLLCELLGAKPLPVTAVGVACQFRSTELVDIDSEAFRECVQDTLDLIEFANGPADSKWGSLRAKMGHPAPFHLEMIGIGNEQWETNYVDLYERYRRFEAAVHAVYPEMKLIGTAGPGVDLPICAEAWDFYRNGEAGKKGFCYAVDEHYYVPPKWLYEHVGFYDRYPREVAVFAGEYAAHTKDRENTMESALAEAAFLTGVEKNAGAVKLASYAPLFNRIGHSQWKPDMIWFDDSQVYVTPSYYVQKLYANHLGDHTLLLEGQEETLRKDGIYVSVSETEPSGTQAAEIIIKAVNATAAPYELPLTDEEGRPLTGKGSIRTLESAGEKSGDRPEPSRITECALELAGSLLLKPQTFTVVRVEV